MWWSSRGLLCVRSPVIDLLALPLLTINPADLSCFRWWDTAGELISTMEDRFDDALLAMAQQPEDADAAPVPQLFENIGHRLELPYLGHMVQFMLDGLTVIMRQPGLTSHGNSSFMRSSVKFHFIL